MKKVALLSSLVLLSGCFDDTSDLQDHISQVQANTVASIEPMPEVPVFDHFDYSVSELRSPFDLPSPEAIQEKLQQMSGCLSPDPRRRKQPLEKFATSTLVMRGTLGDLGTNFALIEASDKTLHRVAVGNYLGLYNGRVSEVNKDNVAVVELIPDGAGCWIERTTMLTIVEAGEEESEGQGK